MDVDHVFEPNVPDSAVIRSSHIVGIGASAGGLSALEQFFDNMPSETGMVFVVIQHLSPDFKSLMDDLLSRHTTMPIHRVTNGIELKANSIYLIPPKTHMTVKEEKLYLTERAITPHIELPIDIFLNSLAEDAGERAVGVVLSGTGSDGSRGIVSIHKNGGLVLVQSPESAQFDGMPRNAIATGVCDFILAPDRIPRILVEYAISPLAVRTRMHDELEVFEDEGEFAELFALLRRGYNLDFSKYKGSTVGRRIRRRMEFRQIPEVADYAAIISGDQGELEHLYKDLLIGVTEFFRDKQAFEFLEQEIIPRLFDNLHRDGDLRVWSAACATGEEAYSIAILLAEKAKEIGFTGKITVFATDVHKTSLDFASQGLYDRARLANVSPERMDTFFNKEGGDLYRVTSELRKLVVFAPHNLLNDPPFTRLDLVCCRNLLIYFQTDVQEKVISLFHFALKIDCILFLGSSEGLGPFIGEFEVLASQHKIFRKIRDLKLAINLDSNRTERMHAAIPVTSFQPGGARAVSIDRQILHDYDALLRRHIPPGVLINENRQIVHYFGNVAEYLKMPEGRTDNNILSLAEDTLHVALSTSLQRADSARQLVVTRNVRIRRGDGDFLIDLNVFPVPDEKSRTTHYHVYFERVRPTEHPFAPDHTEESESTNFDVGNQVTQHVADLEMELQSTRENLQTTVEELQTSNEELQATNEELLASNEELQSTNEELHSVNEELYSVNSEFERKNIELKQLNNDHENLLASSDIGTVFLDRQLRIRKYNPAIAAFFKLLPQDIGRPIDHIAYHLSQQEEMLADIHRVLTSGEPVEQEEQNRGNSWLLRRIMPFRTETGQVEGVVITFTDITTIKEAELKLLQNNDDLEQKVEERTIELKKEIDERLQAEESLREQEKFVHSTIDGLSAHICVINALGNIVITNRAWDSFAVENNAADGTFGKGVNYLEACKIVSEQDQVDINETTAGIKAVLSGTRPEFVKEYPCHSLYEERWFICRVNAFNVSGAQYAVISHINITERKKMEIERIQTQLELLDKQRQLEELNHSLESKVSERTSDLQHQLSFTQSLLNSIPSPVFYKDTKGHYLGCNKAYEEFHGITRDDLIDKSVNDIAPPEYAKEISAIDTELLRTGGSRRYETSLVRSDGSTRDIVFHKACYYDVHGNPNGLIGIIQDVTELKMAENIIKNQNEVLEQRVIERTVSLENANSELLSLNSELELRRRVAEETQQKLQQLSSAVVNSPAIVVITDSFGRIEYVNPKFTETTGYPPEEAIGRNPKILNAGQLPKMIFRELWDTILSGREWRGDFCNRKKNGDVYWEHALISPIKDERGTISHFVAIKEDVTEDRRLASELQAAKDASEAANCAKSEFLAHMSHEIRTPLNAVIGYSALMLGHNLAPGIRDYAGKIHTSGNLLLNIINDILDYSKIESGKLTLEKITFRPEVVIDGLLSMVQQNAREKGLILRSHVPPEIAPFLVGDPLRLTQILVNLLSNAVKFTIHGEVELTTTLLLDVNNRQLLQFSIRDTGIGLTTEQIGKLFRPFTQADESTTRQFGGTGLGLSISKQLVELMGGEISCTSVQGAGSTFSFTAWFGIGQATDADLFEYNSPPSDGNSTSSFDFSGHRILLVEDIQTNQQLVIELLKDTGVSIDVCDNGSDAVAQVCNSGKTYDLVLMDIQMPVMDGYQATRLIRADGRFAGLPIIAMTAHAMIEEQHKILQAGMDVHIAKPINIRILLQVMNLFINAPSQKPLLNSIPRQEPVIPSLPQIDETIGSLEPVHHSEEADNLPRYVSGLDFDTALFRLNGKVKMYKWLLRSFVENWASGPAMIEEALNSGDRELAARHAHSIKGSAGTIGADELEARAQALETAVSSGEALDSVVNCHFPYFAEELNRLIAELTG